MIQRAKWFILTAAFAVVVLLAGGAPSLDQALRAQTPKGSAKKTTTAKKPSKKKAAQHLYKVQYRGAIRNFTFSNKPTAQAAARVLKRQGWSTKVKSRGGQAVVRAKMNRWLTRAVVPTRPQANRIASVLHAQHLQTRIRQIK